MKKRIFLFASALILILICFVFCGCNFNEKNDDAEEEKYCNIIYDYSSIKPITSERVKNGTILYEPEIPVASGYKFSGWYCEEEYINEFIFGKAVTSDIRLYAKWESIYIGVYEKTTDESNSDSLTLNGDGTFVLNRTENGDKFIYCGTYKNNEENLILISDKIEFNGTVYEEENLILYSVNDYAVSDGDKVLEKIGASAPALLTGRYSKTLSNSVEIIEFFENGTYKLVYLYYDESSESVKKTELTNNYRINEEVLYMKNASGKETEFSIKAGYIINTVDNAAYFYKNQSGENYIAGFLIDFDGVVCDTTETDYGTVLAYDKDYTEYTLKVSSTMVYVSYGSVNATIYIEVENLVFLKSASICQSISDGEREEATVNRNTLLCDKYKAKAESRTGIVYYSYLTNGINYTFVCENKSVISVSLYDKEGTMILKKYNPDTVTELTYSPYKSNEYYFVIVFEIKDGYEENIEISFNGN